MAFRNQAAQGPVFTPNGVDLLNNQRSFPLDVVQYRGSQTATLLLVASFAAVLPVPPAGLAYAIQLVTIDVNTQAAFQDSLAGTGIFLRMANAITFECGGQLCFGQLLGLANAFTTVTVTYDTVVIPDIS